MPVLLMKSNKYYKLLVCVCSPSYLARNGHELYYTAMCVWLYHIFPHYLINSTSFGTKLQVTEHTMCGLISSTKFVQNISHSKNSTRYYHKCTYTCKSSIHHSYQMLMKLEFSQQIFKKYSNIKCHENLPSRSRVAPCRQTDKTDRWTDRQISRS